MPSTDRRLELKEKTSMAQNAWLAFVYANGLTFKDFTFCPHSVFMCFVFISEQIAAFAPCSINRLVFITEMKSVYSAVRTGSLNKVVCASSVKG